jgi:hypothetical protein
MLPLHGDHEGWTPSDSTKKLNRYGALAHLGERDAGSVEVAGS